MKLDELRQASRGPHERASGFWFSLFSVFFSGVSGVLFLVFKSVYSAASSLGEGTELSNGLELALRLSAWHLPLGVAAVGLGCVAIFRGGGAIAFLALILGITVCAVPFSML
jgi:hypothetical protein